MKKILLTVIAFILLGLVIVCSNDIGTVNQWVASEMTFESEQDYASPFYDVDFDVIFTHKKTGFELKIPGFWDGGKVFKVRFALTQVGEWSFVTVCSDKDNTGLHNKSGRIMCVEYNGELEIYKRGFVKTDPNLRYFVYDDGTPFFYLGDTHWVIGEEVFPHPSQVL